MILRRGVKQFIDIPFPEALQFDHKHNLSASSKGLKIVTESYHTSLACIGVMIDVGSKNDGASNGLCHLASQLLMTGTKAHPVQSDLQSIFSRIGRFSINSTRDATWLQLLTLKENTEEAFKVLGELLTESTFSQPALTSVKNKIHKENEQLLAIPNYLLTEHLHRIAFKTHGIGGFIRGTGESISKITRSEVAEFVNAHYTSNNMIISACGAVEHNQISELSEKYLWRLPTSKVNKSHQGPEFNSMSIMQESEGDRTYIAIGYPSASYSHPSLHYFQLLQSLLTVNSLPCPLSANFLQNALDVPGFIQHNSYLLVYPECGILIHLLECDGKSAEFVGGAVIQAMNKLGKEITGEELRRAKNLYFNKVLQQESIEKICQSNANQVRSFGKKITRAELASKVLEITPELFVKNIFDWVNSIYPVIAVYGNIVSEDLIEKFYQNAG